MTRSAAMIDALEPRRLFNGGDIDHSFGDNGFATLSKGANIFSLFTLDNGEMIVAGNQNGGLPYVRRLFADGSIDSSFTDGGLVTAIRHEIQNVFSYAIDARGGLLIGGDTRRGGEEILRVTLAGTIDARFAGDGLSRIPLAKIDSITPLSDGRIVVAGVSRDETDSEDSTTDEYRGVLVLNRQGKIDKSFNRGAVAETIDLHSFDDGFTDAYQSLYSEQLAPLSSGGFALLDTVEQNFSSQSGDEINDFPPSYKTTGWIFSAQGRSITFDLEETGGANFQLNGPPQPLDGDRLKVFYSAEVTPDGSTDTTTEDFTVVLDSTRKFQTAQPGGAAFLQAADDDGLLICGTSDSIFRTDAEGRLDTTFSLDSALRVPSLLRAVTRVAADGQILAVFIRDYSDPHDASSFVVKLQRSDAPSGVFEGHDIHAARSGYYFNVHWQDDDGVNLSSLGNDDVYVILPDGTHRSVKLVSTDGVNDATEITATYRVTSPDGQWDATDNGTYQVAIRRGAVSDIHGKFAGGRVIGRFKVNIQPTPEAITIATVMRPAPFSSDRQSLLDLAGIGVADSTA